MVRSFLSVWMQGWPLEPPPSVQDAALALNFRHLYHATWVLGVLNLLHVCLFGLVWTFESAAQQHWADRIALAHALMAVCMGGIHRMLHRCIHAPISSRWSRWMPEFIVVLTFVWAIEITALDVGHGLGLSAYQNACAAIALVVLLRPWVAAVVFLGAALGVVLRLLHSSADTEVLQSLLVNVTTASALALLVSVLWWRRFVQTELLQQSLTQANALLRQQQTELQALATTDALTGLMNRRALMQRMEWERAYAQRHATPLSVLMLDIDHFKRVNDQWGHPAGDAVLQQVAQLMRQSVRKTDVVARLGGEEFVLLLPRTSQVGAAHVAEQLRLCIAQTPLHWAGMAEGNTVALPVSISVTVSMGLVCVPAGHLADAETLIQRADQALYRAKHLGRNRVEVETLPE